VSVIIPAFNAEAFIDETIESVLAQTISDLELVVVDDGSSDSTRSRVTRFGPPVRLLLQERGGPAKARNAGAAAGQGEWVAFLDADDLWLPNKLELQLAEASRSGAALLFTDRYNIGERGPLPERQSDIQPLVDGDIFEPLLFGNFITTSTVLLRREAFEAAGRFSEDPTLPPAEDWDFWLRVAHDHRAAACREPLVRYRHHMSGISRNVVRMNTARHRVISRALALPRGQALPKDRKRRIWGDTWSTNGWDAARNGDRSKALQAYMRSIAACPWRIDPYLGIARVLLSKT